IERRALRHGPRHEDAADLEPEVVVQPRGAMALDHEAAVTDGRGRLAGGTGRRLRGLREIALSAVLLEGHRTECAEPGGVRATGRAAGVLRRRPGVVAE